MITMRQAAQPLADLVDTALDASPYFLGRSMQSETDEGRVVLRGTVASYFQKQMAQETVLRVDGVESVDNLLEVSW